MLFSVAIGTIVGVFLSLSTQTGWFPDPLCRSNIKNLVNAKSKSNVGAYDHDGVFNSDKFESLFRKYATSDKSGNAITILEFIQMTKDQERLGKNVRAWTSNVLDLCSIYFLIGHRGYLSKDDVRAAYDGTLFYRLTDKNKLLIKDQKKGGSDDSSLKGTYLSKPSSSMALEHKFKVLLNSLPSSYAAEYGVNDWISYIQETADSIKKHALRRPVHIVDGVSSPKPYSSSTKAKSHEDPNALFPEGLTGVVKDTSGPSVTTEDYLTSVLSGQPGNDNEPHSTTIFRNLTQDDNQFLTSSGIIGVNASTIKRTPAEKEEEEKAFDSTLIMSGVLRNNDDVVVDGTSSTPSTSLTGVQHEKLESSEQEAHPKPALTPPPEEKSNDEEETAQDE